ncbi:hypothetical protein Tco_0742450 [Tanacetum coccineum]
MEVKKSVAGKLKKAGELIDDADEALDEALEKIPHNVDLVQLKELREVLFGAHMYSQPAKECLKPSDDTNDEEWCPPERDVNKEWDLKTMDEAYPHT